MASSDLDEVRNFVAGIDDRMGHCADVEGAGGADPDAATRCQADLCLEFIERVKQWGRDVFRGKIPFEPEVEAVFRGEGDRLLSRALDLIGRGQESGGSSADGASRDRLRGATEELERLLRTWVTPGLSVSPSARGGLKLEGEALEAVRRKVESMLAKNAIPAGTRVPDEP